jgi:hypothetical protein
MADREEVLQGIEDRQGELAMLGALDFEDEEPDFLPCPVCGGEGGLLGILGSRMHYRCRHCGADFSSVEPSAEMAPVPVPVRVFDPDETLF